MNISQRFWTSDRLRAPSTPPRRDLAQKILGLQSHATRYFLSQRDVKAAWRTLVGGGQLIRHGTNREDPLLPGFVESALILGAQVGNDGPDVHGLDARSKSPHQRARPAGDDGCKNVGIRAAPRPDFILQVGTFGALAASAVGKIEQ